MRVKTLPLEVMRVRMSTSKFLLQGQIIFLTPNLKKIPHVIEKVEQQVLVYLFTKTFLN